MPAQGASRRRVAHLLEAPLRRRGWVIVPALLGALAAAALASLLPPSYRAAAILRVEWTTGDEARLPDPDRRNQAARLRVTETTLLERTLQGAMPYAEDAGATLAQRIERLRSDLRVRPMGGSALAVEFEHRDPAKAALVPNVLARMLAEPWAGAPHAAGAEPGPGFGARFELLAPARVPETSESHDPLGFGLAGALAGILIGLAAAVVAELRDRSVKGPEDLEDVLPVPLLTTVPEVRERKRAAGR
jgi:uncharacterized protein involved in exopolysaccharide biosynthesis